MKNAWEKLKENLKWLEVAVNVLSFVKELNMMWKFYQQRKFSKFESKSVDHAEKLEI